MGKKNGGGDKEAAAGPKATAFVLRVPMHCRCDGCADKIRAGVKDLTLHHGIEALDQSALATKGELRVVSTADPEKLRRRLRKATGKSVDLILLPKPQDKAAAEKAALKEAAAAAAMEELLRRSLQQQQQRQGQHYGYGANQALPGALQQPAGYGYGTAAAAYPWAVQQVPQPEAYPSYHSAYPAASAGAWGAYAYPPATAQGHGGGWYGHGAY